jgi:hypothetical protein
MCNPNNSGDAQNEYRDARRQNNQPGRREHNLIVSDMQVHSLNMRPDSPVFHPFRLPHNQTDPLPKAVWLVLKMAPVVNSPS